MKREKLVRRLAVSGLIAAMYTALCLALTPFTFGTVQCRVAEALTVLAAFTPAAVPGLTVGCVITNLVGVATGANIAGALDVPLGSLATLLAAWLSWRWRSCRVGGLPVLSTLPPVVVNALVVGTELALVSPQFTPQVLLVQIALVGAGQIIACMGGGLLLAFALEKTGAAKKLRYFENC